MTNTSEETTSQSTRADGRGIGALLCGGFGTIAAGIGLWWLGMSGLVWSNGRFWASSSWDDEADLGIAVGVLFFVVWAALMLVAIILSVVGARRAEGQERRSQLITAAVVPLVSIVLILVVMPIVLGQGGAQLIPLDEIGR